MKTRKGHETSHRLQTFRSFARGPLATVDEVCRQKAASFLTERNLKLRNWQIYYWPNDDHWVGNFPCSCCFSSYC